jgi:large subunit ribosomal protein L10
MSEKAIAEKRKVVDDLKTKIEKAKLVLIADYLKFTVKEFTDLRRKLRSENSEIKVIKNTLIGKAVSESGFPQLVEALRGTTAILLGYGDAVSPLKILAKFVKDTEKGSVRIGVVEKNVYGQNDLNALAKLPSKEILIAKVVGGFKAPIYGLVNVLQGPIRKLVYALDAIKAKKGGE